MKSIATAKSVFASGLEIPKRWIFRSARARVDRKI
jgi:hypothetical protein